MGVAVLMDFLSLVIGLKVHCSMLLFYCICGGRTKPRWPGCLQKWRKVSFQLGVELLGVELTCLTRFELMLMFFVFIYIFFYLRLYCQVALYNTISKEIDQASTRLVVLTV